MPSYTKSASLLFMLLGLMVTFGCGKQTPLEPKSPAKAVKIFPKQDLPTGNQQLTFVELGSKTCIPCVQMKKVMEQVSQKYGSKIKMVFHDIWSQDGRGFAKAYSIRLIPTQVFVNQQGNEVFRHEGFWPFEEVEKFLAQQKITPNE